MARGFLKPTCVELRAGAPRIVKVFPLRIDSKNRTALTPSLFDRDAYQAFLRKNPKQCTGMVFKVQSKVPAGSPTSLTAKLEVRGEKAGDQTSFTAEKRLERDKFGSTWFQFDVTGEAWGRLKGVSAWRISLFDGEKLVSEQKSFLW